MIKTLFVLTLSIGISVASADQYTCNFQEQFILGNQNLFINEFKVSNCSKPSIISDETKACDCAVQNQKIIGPNSDDISKVKSDINKQNTDMLNEIMKKHVLAVIDDFTLIDGKYTIGSAANSCSLSQLKNLKCNNENSILKSINTQSDFLNNIVKKAQCEIEAQYSSNECSNGERRIRDEVPRVSCLSEAMINKMKLQNIEKDFHKLLLSLKSGENTDQLDKFRSHPLLAQLISSKETSEAFFEKIKGIELNSENNLQLIQKLQEPELLALFSKGIENKCNERLKSLKEILCLPIDNLSDTTKDIAKTNLDNKNINLDKSHNDYKQLKRENFLEFQHELGHYCQEVRGREKLLTNKDIVTSHLPIEYQTSSLGEVFNIHKQDIVTFENKFCPLLGDNKSKFKLDSLLSRYNCPNHEQCSNLESYLSMMSEAPSIQNENGDYVFSSNITMSPQLKTIYGIEEGQQAPTIQSRSFTAYNDSPVVKDLTPTTKSVVNNNTSSRSTSSTSETSTTPQFDNVTVAGTSTDDNHFYQNRSLNSNRPSVRRVSNSSSNPGTNNTNEEVIYQEESSDLGRPTVTKRTVTRDRSKIEQQVDELKDEMIDNLSEQLKEMRNLASKAIDINNQFAPSSASNFIGEVPSGNFVSPSNNQHNGQINTNRNIDEVVPSNVSANGQGINTNTISNTRTPSSTAGSQAAIVNVRPSSQNNSSNNIDEIEVTFKPGEKPALLLLQDEDYNKIITYLKEKKTFILTKKFNIAGAEETFSAQITPINNGKYEIEVLNKDLDRKVSKEKLTALQNEIIEALKVASKDNASTKEISLRLD